MLKTVKEQPMCACEYFFCEASFLSLIFIFLSTNSAFQKKKIERKYLHALNVKLAKLKFYEIQQKQVPLRSVSKKTSNIFFLYLFGLRKTIHIRTHALTWSFILPTSIFCTPIIFDLPFPLKLFSQN